MKIVILEDSIERTELFGKIFDSFKDTHEINVFPAMNVKEAILYTEEIENIDFYLLDHDLGDSENVNSQEENTGYQFAKYLAESGNDGSNVIIHSMNMPGAENMRAKLPNATLIPFMLIVQPGLSQKRFLSTLGLDS